MEKFWNAQSSLAKAGLIATLGLFVIVLAAAALWSLRPTYGVLFTGLDQRDTALMVSELDKLKQPYRLEEGSILVPETDVLTTRIKVMGKELPLHGAVGFELFNQSDFGVTEFAQKVNYQRALQGELTRTILSISGVKSARVHLVMPEQGLFRKPATRAKASVTLGIKEGATLQADQVIGIQRLVSSAVPDVSMQDVTIVSQKGVALTKSQDAAATESSPAVSSRLEYKRDTENYLARKATAILEQAFGAGNAMVSVDALLNLDQLKVITEDALPARGDKPAGAGVMIKEREVRRASNDTSSESKGDGQASSTQREAEYVVGKRVEHLVTAPGAVKRLSISVVVAKSLDAVQTDRVQALVANAMGFSQERGDSISVYSMDQLTGSIVTPLTASHASLVDTKFIEASESKGITKYSKASDKQDSLLWFGFLLLAVTAVFFVVFMRAQSRSTGSPDAVSLGTSERAMALRQIQDWLGNVDTQNQR